MEPPNSNTTPSTVPTAPRVVLASVIPPIVPHSGATPVPTQSVSTPSVTVTPVSSAAGPTSGEGFYAYVYFCTGRAIETASYAHVGHREGTQWLGGILYLWEALTRHLTTTPLRNSIVPRAFYGYGARTRLEFVELPTLPSNYELTVWYSALALDSACSA